MTHPLFDITGRTALVTGSSRGIGRALARGLLEAGATVVLNARDAERLERARAELVDETGGTAYALAFDVTDSAAVERGVEQTLDAVGGLDILVTTRAPSTARRSRSSRMPTGTGSWRPTSRAPSSSAVPSPATW